MLLQVTTCQHRNYYKFELLMFSPLSYLTAESEPFSSDRVQPPLHPSNTLTIYAVTSVLPSVLPHCIVWCGLHPNPYSPCDHLCSHPTSSESHPHCIRPPPLTTHAVTSAPIELLATAYGSSPQFYSTTNVCLGQSIWFRSTPCILPIMQINTFVPIKLC